MAMGGEGGWEWSLVALLDKIHPTSPPPNTPNTPTPQSHFLSKYIPYEPSTGVQDYMPNVRNALNYDDAATTKLA